MSILFDNIEISLINKHCNIFTIYQERKQNKNLTSNKNNIST